MVPSLLRKFLTLRNRKIGRSVTRRGVTEPPARPEAILFNGGFVLPSIVRDRIANWFGDRQVHISVSPSDASSDTFLPDAEVKAGVSGSSLFSFVDLKDPFSPSDIAGEDLPGPILSLIGARKFDFLFLFHTPHTRNNAVETEREILLRCPDCHVNLHQLPVSDPKDYSFVMAALTREVRKLVNEVRARNNYVCVSSGTAEMRAAWFLLTALHVLPAKLLQVDAPLFGQVNVKEIVDTRDWQTVRNVLMPFRYTSPSPLGERPNIEIVPAYKVARKPVPQDEMFLDETDSNAGEEGPEEHMVPGLDAALQELGIHIGSAKLRYAAERAGVAAGSSLPVLLLGETGTGKERFAHLIHRLSPRSSREMVAINCAAIPKELAESYLFGHTKGGFSGAIADKRGVFEDADHSTLFLDEVAELPLEIQAKLLRVIQDGSFHRVGSTKLLHVDVRMVAATNRDLAQEVAAGRFREDLYFRLEVVQVKLPSLRERRAEIPELALFILRQINQRRLKPRQLSKEALARLEHYHWPGNVRELHNVLERSVLYAPKESLKAEHLQIEGNKGSIVNLSGLPEPFEGFSLEDYLNNVREGLIRRALETSGGNQAEAGRLLGMSRQAINKFLAERSG
jgi:DNA-binding NtrC family response regulator